GLAAIALIVGFLPSIALGRSDRPTGEPLLWYVVHIRTFPPVPPAVPPPVCVLAPGQSCSFTISFVPVAEFDLEDCTPDAFATREEAEAAVLGRAPQQDWHVAQAIDVPHALAAAERAVVLASLPPNTPVPIRTSLEQQLLDDEEAQANLL